MQLHELLLVLHGDGAERVLGGVYVALQGEDDPHEGGGLARLGQHGIQGEHEHLFQLAIHALSIKMLRFAIAVIQTFQSEITFAFSAANMSDCLVTR